LSKNTTFQAIGYLRDQMQEQLEEICSAFANNLRRIAAGQPPHTPNVDAADGEITLAFDAATIGGVGNELPGESVFGRSMLMRQLSRKFKQQCQEGIDSQKVRRFGGALARATATCCVVPTPASLEVLAASNWRVLRVVFVCACEGH